VTQVHEQERRLDGVLQAEADDERGAYPALHA
jgi:hypothetical protein